MGWTSLVVAILAGGGIQAKPVTIARPMTVTSATEVAPGKYVVPDAGGGVVRIEADNVVVDFKGAILRSREDVWHDLDKLDGVGILIRGRKNVTIRNARVEGFRWNVRVEDCQNVTLENCDLGNSRAIRMMRDGRAVDTFLNLRDAEAWRSYGAAVWMERSKGCTVTRCRGAGAQNGVLMVDCSACTVHNNDFSFNAGWGVCMARSSDSVISWNHLDFVNRPWAGGWGGDSAAIGVADDCDRNFFVGNSMTHGGDGFFLSNRNDVGFNQTSGLFEPKGGSDDNVIANNDGSWSTANAFEGTFSERNVYVDNQANSSNFGFWLGFSSSSLIAGNTIRNNLSDGIAIEHGSKNRIVGNEILMNGGSAIHLWASPETARRNFPSATNDITGNTLNGYRLNLTGSTDTLIADNKIVSASTPTLPPPESANRKPLSGRQAFDASATAKRLKEILATKPQGWVGYAESDRPKGIQWLRAGEFAPNDFRADLAAVREVDPGAIELYLVETGVKINAPDSLGFDPTPDNARLVRISVRPDPSQVGGIKPYRVVVTSADGKRKQVVEGTMQTSTWNVKWFSWAGMTYEDAPAWKRLFESKPIAEENTRLLGGDYTGRSPAAGVPASHFAMVATTKMVLPEGRYRLSTLSDDGIKVFVDGRLVIDRWNHHGPTPDEATLTLDPAPHTIRVEYCQEDGAAVLRLAWTKLPS